MEKNTYPYWQVYSKYRRYNILAFAVLLLFGIGFFAGWFAAVSWTGSQQEEVLGRERHLSGYKLINPLLECETATDPRLFRELRSFREKVDALLRDRKAGYGLDLASVYFRDLGSGHWFGINEHEKFSPASLLKVPTMIACLKQAEGDPSFLSKRITYSGDEDYNALQTIKPLDSIRPGRSYSVDELLYKSIAQSDNNANVLLFNTVDRNLLVDTYRALNVALPTRSQPANFLSVASYAAFFRVLYNASYLNREMSHKALTLLAESDFKEGIMAGVPSTVIVAQKFGERASRSGESVKQLHDCGIVYYPGKPYLLCIMSRGSNIEMLDDIIRDVSRLVYQEVDAQFEKTTNEQGKH